MRSVHMFGLLMAFFFQSADAGGCHIELHPPRVVVRHGDPVSVNCTVSTDHSGMGWQAPVNDVPNTPGVKFLTWRVESLTMWNIRPLCFANRPGKPQCKERLSVTVYKTPDSVSVSSVNSTDSMVEGNQYQLKCEIQNIAPVQSLTVKWYKGGTLVHEDRDHSIEDGKSDRKQVPVSVSSTLLITPSRADDGAEYSCEAELGLGPEGPQPPLAVKSTHIKISVSSPQGPVFWMVAIAVISVAAFVIFKYWMSKKNTVQQPSGPREPGGGQCEE